MTFSITLLACDISAIVRLLAHILGSPFFGIGTWMDSFHCFGQILFIQICWHIAVNTFIASSSTSFNSSMGIPSDPDYFPLDSAFKAFLTSPSNIVASSSHSFLSYMGIGQIRMLIWRKQLTEFYVVLAVILINDTYVANLYEWSSLIRIFLCQNV